MTDTQKPSPRFANFEERKTAALKVKADRDKQKLSPGDPHAKARTRRGALYFTKPSKTVRSQAYETDINNMVKGLTPFTQARRPGYYIDETILPLNYEAQFNAVLQAQEAFMKLPPDIRSAYDNDPAKLASALSDPSRQDDLRRLGILSPLPPPPKEPENAPEPPPAPSGGAS